MASSTSLCSQDSLELKKRESYSQIMSEKISKMLDEAQTLCDTGQPKAAVARLTRAISLQPHNSQLFEKRAEAYMLIKEFDSAIANFQKVLSLRQEDCTILERLGVVHWLYGEVLYNEGRYSQAVEVYERAAEYRTDDKNIVMRRISCLLALERYGECVEMIKNELEVDDTNPELYVLRAKLKLMFGDTSVAYYDVCSALNLDPRHSVALSMKAELEESALQCKHQAVHHSLMGRKMDALKKISTAIETDPAVAEYHIFRGALYRRLKDFEAAVDDFLTAMDKVSHQQDCDVYKNASRQLVLTYNDFAMECFRQRHFNEAVVLLNKAIKEEKTEKGLYLNRGDCFYRLNNLHFALSDYQQALELDPTNWDVSCRIGIVCSELGVESYSREQYSQAEGHFTAAIRHNPKVSRFYLCRARARLMQKNVAGTKKDLLSALILDPNNEEYISLIARVFPSKSKEDLLQSEEAEQRRQQLEAEMQQLTVRSYTGSASYVTTRTISEILNGLELKFEDSESSPLEKGARHDKVPTFKHPPTIAENTQEDTAVSMGTSHKDGGVEIAPRNWSVLTHPLPELTHDPHGVMPVLRDCLSEHSFHKKIYYSKKNATEAVQRVLKSPPTLSQPIKLDKPPSTDNIAKT